MPAAMHSFYLRNMYQENLLREPGGISLKGVPIDLSMVNLPAYFLSTREDHIAPWKSTYRGTQTAGGHEALRAGGVGPYRRRGQSAGGRQIQPLDQRPRSRRSPMPGKRRRPRSRVPGGRTGSAGSPAWHLRRFRRATRGRRCPPSRMRRAHTSPSWSKCLFANSTGAVIRRGFLRVRGGWPLTATPLRFSKATPGGACGASDSPQRIRKQTLKPEMRS